MLDASFAFVWLLLSSFRSNFLFSWQLPLWPACNSLDLDPMHHGRGIRTELPFDLLTHIGFARCARSIIRFNSNANVVFSFNLSVLVDMVLGFLQ